jgi:exopolysaccharide biosynthesis polyprenyl glycosylphosphotransferase
MASASHRRTAARPRRLHVSPPEGQAQRERLLVRRPATIAPPIPEPPEPAEWRHGLQLVIETNKRTGRSRSAASSSHRRRTLAGDTRGFVLRRWLAVSDLTALVLAWAVVVAAGAALGRSFSLGADALLFALCLPLWLGIANALGLYHLPDRRLGHSMADEIGPIAFALTMWSWGFLVLRAAAGPNTVELLPMVVLWTIALVAVPGLRAVTRAIARRRAFYQQRVAVLGTPVDVGRVVRRLRRHPELGLDIACLVKITTASDGLDDPIGLGSVARDERRPADGADLAANLAAAVARADVNRVILASAPGDMDQRSALLRALSEMSVHVDLVSADSDVIPSRGSLHYIEGLPMMTISAVRRPRTRTAFKRGFDVFVSGLGMLVLSPMLAWCALRIRLDTPGPILFRQQRVGRGGRTFEMLKFRTMVSDAETLKTTVDQLNFHTDSETPGMFKIPSDPRVTSSGHTLRRWSLDELPQLWNVLRGDMSLVGPRPLIPEEATLVSGRYEARLNARPGITGPWQTLGRSDIGFEDMIKLDYTYVNNWSFAEDLKLLARTVATVFGGRGAY